MRKTIEISQPKDWFKVKEEMNEAEKNFRERHDVSKVKLSDLTPLQVINKFKTKYPRSNWNFIYFIFYFINYSFKGIEKVYTSGNVNYKYAVSLASVVKRSYYKEITKPMYTHYKNVCDFIRELKNNHIQPLPAPLDKKISVYEYCKDTNNIDSKLKQLLCYNINKGADNNPPTKPLADNKPATIQNKCKQLRSESYLVVCDDKVMYTSNRDKDAFIYTKALKDLQKEFKMFKVVEIVP